MANPTAREREAMSDWRPIETAPKEGQDVLACFKGQFEWVMFIAICGRFGPKAHGYADPTHWMPLPDAPKDPA